MVNAKLQQEVNDILTEAALKGEKFAETPVKTYEVDPGIKALETDYTPKEEAASQVDSAPQAEAASEPGESQDDGYNYGMGQ